MCFVLDRELVARFGPTLESKENLTIILELSWKLAEHLKLAKEIKAHKEEVCALQYQMSHDALQQMPDFQGRVYHINILF